MGPRGELPALVQTSAGGEKAWRRIQRQREAVSRRGQIAKRGRRKVCVSPWGQLAERRFQNSDASNHSPIRREKEHGRKHEKGVNLEGKYTKKSKSWTTSGDKIGKSKPKLNFQYHHIGEHRSGRQEDDWKKGDQKEGRREERLQPSQTPGKTLCKKTSYKATHCERGGGPSPVIQIEDKE